MSRVALYARYSSDRQRTASIEDQLRLCRDHATARGWTIVSTYADEAASGTSLNGRPGMLAMLGAAREGRFDIVAAEALDRLSRDQEDIARLFKMFRFAGIGLSTVTEGQIDELHVGLKGTMNALFLTDLVNKTRRGLRDRIEQGRLGGGLCYGYDVRIDADGEVGGRIVNEAQADIVRRILTEYADGAVPRVIAERLNKEGISGVGGRPWTASTIRGHRARGSGMINNALYVGELVWNRQRFVRHPETGRRVSRVNPESEWVRRSVPALRIVSDRLWQAVRARDAAVEQRSRAVSTGIRRSRDIAASGVRQTPLPLRRMLICGECGGSVGQLDRGRYGCSDRVRHRNCGNAAAIRGHDIEMRVAVILLDGLKRLDHATVGSNDDDPLARERRMAMVSDRHALAEVERGLAGFLAAIEDGLYLPAMKARMTHLDAEGVRLRARIRVASTMADAEQAEALRHCAALGQLIERVAAGRAGYDDIIRLRDLFGPIALLPTGERGACRLVEVGKPGST